MLMVPLSARAESGNLLIGRQTAFLLRADEVIGLTLVTSDFGTNRTNGAGRSMSVYRGRSEVLDPGQTDANDPKRSSAPNQKQRLV